jgi:superfamily II DNA or RNA helicase
VGRVLRPAPGKTSARIHDHAGCLAAHGTPFAPRDYSPTTSSRGTRDEEQMDADTRKRNLCPSCKSVRSGYPCDNCGFSPTPEELKIEFEEAAHAKAIVEENSPEALKRRQLEVNFRGSSLAERRAFFERMVLKHGPKKAVGVYRWWSGETAWPPREWRTEQGEARHA